MVDGVTYIVSGGAAKARPADRADFTAVAWSTHHFLDIVIQHDRMDGRAVDQQGRVIDAILLSP